MILKKKQLQVIYDLIYVNQKVKPSKSQSVTKDPITYMNYVPSEKKDRELITKIRSCMELLDVCRSDFPSNWRNYCSSTFQERAKEKGRLLLRKNSMFGFELLMKAWWVREEIDFKINFNNIEDVYKLISFNNYMNDVFLNFLELKNKYGLWNNISDIKVIAGYTKISEKKWDNYFRHLIIKYNVDINKKTFIKRFY